MKKLAIVGSHPGTRELIPWDDTDFDIWTINEAATQKDSWVKRCTGIFQMHPRHVWDNPNNRNDPHHGEWLKANTTIPVYMLDKYPDVPMAVKYPLDEISDKYLANLKVISHASRNRFFTCTVAYMAALAAYKGYEQVDFYGVELAVDSEYRYQRPGAAFWIGLLCQHAKVTFCGQMLDAPMYGIEKEGEVEKDLLLARLKNVEPKAAETEKAMREANAVLGQTFNRFRDTGVEYENVVVALQETIKRVNAFGFLSGSVQELKKRIQLLDDMVALDGDYHFSHHEFQRDADALTKEREKTGYEQARISGMIDTAFSLAVDERLHDTRRKKFLAIVDNLIPEYGKLTEKMGVYTGAMMENKLLANVVKEEKDDSSQ